MGSGFNLPPGCYEDDLPGNTKQDRRLDWEITKIREPFFNLFEKLENIIEEVDLSGAENEAHGKRILGLKLISEINDFIS